jgi:hypothetical protein
VSNKFPIGEAGDIAKKDCLSISNLPILAEI